MSFPMGSQYLYDYDVYPKVVRAGRPVTITIRPQGCRFPFVKGGDYDITVKAVYQGDPKYYPSANYVTCRMTCCEDDCLRFTHTFPTEQEYFLDFVPPHPDGRTEKVRLSVYCLNDDLCGLYPFIGDLHMHTTRSDGRQDPTTVCANYRRHGYDFMVVSDHRRYMPSLEAMRFYKDVPTELCIVPGEEVHLPRVRGKYIEPHIVNFGGEYSVNALIERPELEPELAMTENRSLNGVCPPVMTQAEYEDMIEARAASLDVPEGVDAITAAGTGWVFDEIRRSGGLAIYAHPTWINDTFHVPDTLHRYFVENKMFDAFEVLGGENYYEQNGYQTVQYYEDKARGYDYPIVGSTDSHSSYPTNRNAFICSTIIFADRNERTAIIDAVKSFRSVAVDTISAEFRLVGDIRLVRYACFLIKNYFPIHDEFCIEEGRLMRQAATGSPEEKEEAVKTLTVINGRVHRLLNKYFSF